MLWTQNPKAGQTGLVKSSLPVVKQRELIEEAISALQQTLETGQAPCQITGGIRLHAEKIGTPEEPYEARQVCVTMA